MNERERDVRELAADVLNELIARRKTIAVAESSTGGLIGHLLTEVPGASAVFLGGVVAYNNRLKEKIGVSPETLATAGAVSQETAEEMAEGVRHWAGADIGVAETGVAGPAGGSRPVGLFHTALADGRVILRGRIIAEGERSQAKQACARAVLELLQKYLDESRA